MTAWIVAFVVFAIGAEIRFSRAATRLRELERRLGVDAEKNEPLEP